MSENAKEINVTVGETNQELPRKAMEDSAPQQAIWEKLDYINDAIIEASAGTGKTYTLQHIVLELVRKQRKVDAKKILLVTFTKKAAGELRDRIRAVFAENGGVPKDFDEMTISTIHSFCQDLLKEYAFENGVQMQTNLADKNAIREKAISNVIKSIRADTVQGRHFVSFMKLNGIISFENVGSYPKMKRGLLTYVRDRMKEFVTTNTKSKTMPSIEDIEKGFSCVEEKEKTFQSIMASFKGFLEDNGFSNTTDVDTFIQDKIIAGFSFNKNSKETVPGAYKALIDLARRDEVKIGDASCLKYEHINVRGTGKDKGHNLLDTKDGTKLELLKGLSECISITNENKEKLIDYLAVKIMEEIKRIKRTEALLTYDDMIEKTAKIIEQESKRESLKESSDFLNKIRERYHIALVDEFQDTDNLQWGIFNKLFSHKYNQKGFLLVVGDPKQAIYSFRGADIRTYVDARNEILTNIGGASPNNGSLDKTYRSTRELIDAFNTLFGTPGWFSQTVTVRPGVEGKIKYTPVKYPEDNKKFDDIKNFSDAARPVCLLESIPTKRSGEFNTECSDTARVKTFANNAAMEILKIRKKGLNDGAKLRPKYGDFCFLIQRHEDEYPIKRTLQKYGIPFSVYKEQGLYNSIEAESILVLFDFLVRPHNAGNLNALLLTPFFGLQLEDLQQMNKVADEARQKILDKMSGQWGNWTVQRKWELLFHDFMTNTKISEPQKGDFDFDRRWTAFQQIFDDLLAQCAKTALTISDFSDALRTWGKDASKTEEGAALRQRENDEEHVKIMTMHMSKGLEFPVVFIPTGMKTSEGNDETKRLFYVAITRAKYRVYLPWTKCNEQTGNRIGSGFLSNAIVKYFKEKPEEMVIDHRKDKPEELAEILTAETNVLEEKGADAPKNNDYVEPCYPQNAIMRWDSFSSLAHHGSQQGDKTIPDIPSEDSSEATLDTQRENDEIGIQTSEEEEAQTVKSLLPRGTTSGTVFHEIMESLCKETDGLGFDIAEKDLDEMIKTITPLIEGIMRRNGLENLQDDADNNTIRTLARLVYYALNTEITIGNEKFMLKDIPHSDRAAEVNFVISERTALEDQDAPDGAFNGSIDLIVKHEEQFYIIDWKTNTLQNYLNDTVKQAMDDANYHLQYKLYAVETAKWLGLEKVAGVAYLFVRGGENGKKAGTFFEEVTQKKINDYANEIFKLLDN